MSSERRSLKLRQHTVWQDKKLGEGAFGEVFEARDQSSGHLYALKKIGVSFLDNEYLGEIETLSKCTKHQHIVTLYDVGFKSKFFGLFTSNVLILMEYCSGGNLNRRLARSDITEDLKLRWMSELADAIRFLHSQDIVHRDLKPENVLLTSTDSIKLSDFGLARELSALKQGSGVASDKAFVSYMTNGYMGQVAGTPLWMAPEVFNGHYKERADIFSLGAIFYAIQTLSYEIFKGEKYFVGMITVNGEKHGFGKALQLDPNTELPLSSVTPWRRRELIEGMLRYNYKQRFSADQIYNAIQRIKKGEKYALTGALPAVFTICGVAVILVGIFHWLFYKNDR